MGTQHDPDASSRQARPRISIVVAAAGVAVALMIAIGALRVVRGSAVDDPEVEGAATLSGSSVETSPAASSTVVPPPSSVPVSLSDVVFVDVLTGRTTPLPRTIRAVAELGRIDVSTNGSRVTFSGSEGIHVAGIDGSRLRVVAAEPGASAPGWFPDGRRIVYVHDRSIKVLDLRTGAVEVVARMQAPPLYPNVSPDGRTILFTKQARGGLELWTISLSGGDDTLLLRLGAPHTNAAFGSYSSGGAIAYRRTQYDGMDITHMTEASVFAADASGSHRRPITHTGSWMSQIDPERLWPSWSPDGSMIAFERLYEQGVVVVDTRDGPRVVIEVPRGFDPVWADDRTLIVAR